jgi:hypothetical protein
VAGGVGPGGGKTTKRGRDGEDLLQVPSGGGADNAAAVDGEGGGAESGIEGSGGGPRDDFVGKDGESVNLFDQEVESSAAPACGDIPKVELIKALDDALIVKWTPPFPDQVITSHLILEIIST